MSELPNNFIPSSQTPKIECRACGLAGLCFPHGLTMDELENLDSLIKTKKKLDRDEILFHAGDKTAPIYAISSGSFKTSIINHDGVEQITGFYLPGEILGLDGLGGSAPNSTATSLETSTACELPPVEFDKLCETNHGLRQQMMRLVSREIGREQQMMMTLGQMTADERLAGFLIGLAHRYEERGFSAFEFNLSMSRHDLANYLGLAVETLSRLFRKFQENSQLEVKQRNVRIIDWDKLCDTAHAECAVSKVRPKSKPRSLSGLGDRSEGKRG